MQPEVADISSEQVSALSRQLLDQNGRIKLLPARFYRQIPPLLFRAWCNRTARYHIPTVESIDWLKRAIANRSAIEIGSGNGDLYYHLGIPGTDSYCQQQPEVMAQYKKMGQIPTHPPADVLRMDAVEAIAHFKPEVVIGAWITQRLYENEPPSKYNLYGNVYGVEEHKIIELCEYIHIGNNKIHALKRIDRYRHQILKFSGLVSRASAPEEDRIYVWKPAVKGFGGDRR